MTVLLARPTSLGNIGTMEVEKQWKKKKSTKVNVIVYSTISPFFCQKHAIYIIVQRFLVSVFGSHCEILHVCVLSSSGAAIEEVNKHWDWLVRNLLRSLSVFENKDDVASFVKGKVKVNVSYILP